MNHNKEHQLEDIVTVEQLVQSFYIAKEIKRIQNQNHLDLINQEDYNFYEKFKPDISNIEVQQLFERFIKLARHNEKLTILCKVALEDIFKHNFIHDPSISENRLDYKHLTHNFNQTEFATLKKINLEEHTINVFRKIIEIMEENDIYDAGVYMLAALLHDFGKSSEIREDIAPGSSNPNSTSYKQHWEVSAEYVRNRLKEEGQRELKKFKIDPEIKQTITIIADLVAHHHDKSKAWQKKIQYINLADHAARIDEVKSLED